MKKILFTLLFLSNIAIAETTIYLVRHAEKITTEGVKDPELTAIGHFRALNIAKQLSEVGITEIYSTNYKRTLQTAKPLADYLNLEIKNYDPRKLIEFSEEIKSKKGTILIVGHSNTTPKLTSLISGETVAPIEEQHEYDNLYQVIMTDTQTILNRFKSIPSYTLDDKQSVKKSITAKAENSHTEKNTEKNNEDNNEY